MRPMRRSAQILPPDETEAILLNATSGVLALSGDDGYPYAVPMSFAYSDGRIYFHSAVEGHKIDCIKRSEKASFCVIAEDGVIPEKYTTAYKSVIAFGRIRFADGAEKIDGLKLLGRKYAPDGSPEDLKNEISGALERVAVLVFDIDALSGKEAKELMMKRRKKE